MEIIILNRRKKPVAILVGVTTLTEKRIHIYFGKIFNHDNASYADDERNSQYCFLLHLRGTQSLTLMLRRLDRSSFKSDTSIRVSFAISSTILTICEGKSFSCPCSVGPWIFSADWADTGADEKGFKIAVMGYIFGKQNPRTQRTNLEFNIIFMKRSGVKKNVQQGQVVQARSSNY